MRVYRVSQAPDVAVLTADDRDQWAEVRPLVKQYNPANSALIQLIEDAAFVVCLDEGSPTSPTERANHFVWSNIPNRWSDKTLLRKLNERVIQAIKQAPPNLDADNQEGDVFQDDVHIEKYTFDVDQTLKAHTHRVQDSFQNSCIATEWHYFNCRVLGASFFKLHNCTPKGGYQLVIQLASLYNFGYQPPSWETVTMRAFHKGRVDIIQTVLPPVAEFCASMSVRRLSSDSTTDVTNPSKIDNKQHLLALFHKAALAYTDTVTRISRGRGFAHHLYALRRSSPRTKTHRGCFWIRYTVRRDPRRL
ncbi:MAG: hypothetical protein Q9226_005208 [Calogaya cf. arnoldii]